MPCDQHTAKIQTSDYARMLQANLVALISRLINGREYDYVPKFNYVD